MAEAPAGEPLQGKAPVRRSARSRRAPASYAEPEDEDGMEGLEVGGGGGNGVVLLAPLPPAEEKFSMKFIIKAAPRPPSFSSRVRKKIQDDSVSDPDYELERVRQRRRKLDNVASLPCGGISQEMSRDLEMMKICTRLKVDFALFDAWPGDPAVIGPRIPHLPNEILYQILENCRSEVLVKVQRSCPRFRAMIQQSPGLWLRVRQKYYPGLPDELRFGLDEESLIELATGRDCDYCTKLVKSKAYYLWGVRACSDCIKELTMCITDFRNLLKRKCKGDKEWTHSAREQVCAALRWRGGPFASRSCWKSEAYALMEEAESHMLDGTFHQWILTREIPNSEMYEARKLESWGASVAEEIELDQLERERISRRFNKANFIHWCMLLPKPIPASVLRLTNTYKAIRKTTSHITKYEFVTKLPKLLKECRTIVKPARDPAMKKYRVNKNSGAKVVGMGGF